MLSPSGHSVPPFSGTRIVFGHVLFYILPTGPTLTHRKLLCTAQDNPSHLPYPSKLYIQRNLFPPFPFLLTFVTRTFKIRLLQEEESGYIYTAR